jgi:hypothetical protein
MHFMNEPDAYEVDGADTSVKRIYSKGGYYGDEKATGHPDWKQDVVVLVLCCLFIGIIGAVIYSKLFYA